MYRNSTEYVFVSSQEALQCVQEMNSPQLLYVFVRNGMESTMERSTITREHMGLLFHQLIKNGTLSTEQYFKGSVQGETPGTRVFVSRNISRDTRR